jgi:hypothetical protein
MEPLSQVTFGLGSSSCSNSNSSSSGSAKKLSGSSPSNGNGGESSGYSAADSVSNLNATPPDFINVQDDQQKGEGQSEEGGSGASSDEQVPKRRKLEDQNYVTSSAAYPSSTDSASNATSYRDYCHKNKARKSDEDQNLDTGRNDDEVASPQVLENRLNLDELNYNAFVAPKIKNTKIPRVLASLPEEFHDQVDLIVCNDKLKDNFIFTPARPFESVFVTNQNYSLLINDLVLSCASYYRAAVEKVRSGCSMIAEENMGSSARPEPAKSSFITMEHALSITQQPRYAE